MQTKFIDETSRLKPWDYVTYTPGDKDITGIVVKHEGDDVWLTNISDDCDIIIVKREYLKGIPAPKLFWNFQWADDLHPKFRGMCTHTIDLYPSNIYRESAILWRSLQYKAQAEGFTIYRDHIGRDHYHYYIPGLKAFCNEDYA